MKTLLYDNIGVAERVLREREKNHLIVDHELDAGKGFDEDAHPSNEWVIIPPGESKCELTIDGVSQIIEADSAFAKAILIEAGARHSFRAITYIFYTVLRDGLG